MDTTVGVTEARGRLGEIVDKVRYQGDTVVLMKSGKPAAAIVPYAMFERWKAERADLFAVVDEIRQRNQGLDMSEEELSEVIDSVIREVRSAH